MSYDDQLQDLEQLRSNLMQRLEGLDSGTMNQAPQKGGWSAAQVLAHIVAAESRSLAYLKKKMQDPDSIPPSGLAAAIKSRILGLVMKSPIKVSAPPGAGDVPERAELEELAQEWSTVREGWRSFLADFPGGLTDRGVYKHPVAGRLNLTQTLGFLAEHLRRHTGQIERCLASIEAAVE